MTAAINHAKDHGDLATLRRIAEDPHGFILRQGWAALDLGEEREIAQLRRLWESIELEIIRVLEAGHALKESPDYEQHRLTTQTPAFLFCAREIAPRCDVPKHGRDRVFLLT